jgi:UDP-N-acetylmuramate--alanine ligase
MNKDVLFPGRKHFHFVGIGGVGMSALAKALTHKGFVVSGSDRQSSPSIDKLKSYNISVTIGHDQKLPEGVSAVVVSTAISPENAAVKEAKALNIPLLHRSDVLAEFLNKLQSIGVTGTHGKTTTSALTAFLMERLGWNPTALVGGNIINIGDNVILGSDEWVVAEVDESDKSHCRYHPAHSIITNIEIEHLDHYENLDEIKSCFQEYGNNTRAGGFLIINSEDHHLRKLFKETQSKVVTFGYSHEADFWAHKIQLGPSSSTFDLFHHEEFLGAVTLHISGLHNVSNALASLAMLISLGANKEQIIEAIKDFKGTSRRLEVKLDTEELLVVDDYAHHPSEIRASLLALGRWNRKITAVFQPHRFSRVEGLLDEFATSFKDADRLILTDVYGAGEVGDGEESVSKILESIRNSGHPNVSFVDRNSLIKQLEPSRDPRGEVFAFLGAGDIGEVADAFAIKFKY